MFRLVGDEASAIDFEDEDVVDYSYLAAIYEADAALVTVDVDGGADAGAFVNVTCLGEELDVEGHALYLLGGLGVSIPYLALTGEWVYPLPLLSEAAEFCVGLGGAAVHSSQFIVRSWES